MTTKLETLQLALQTALGEGAAISSALGEVTVVVKAADYIRYCAEDDETRVIACYLEGVADGRRFADPDVESAYATALLATA